MTYYSVMYWRKKNKKNVLAAVNESFPSASETLWKCSSYSTSPTGCAVSPLAFRGHDLLPQWLLWGWHWNEPITRGTSGSFDCFGVIDSIYGKFKMLFSDLAIAHMHYMNKFYRRIVFITHFCSCFILPNDARKSTLNDGPLPFSSLVSCILDIDG